MFVNEDVNDFLKGKSDEEVRSIITKTGIAPASYIAKILNDEKGENFKANFTGAWDLFGPIIKAEVTQINRGKGFEDSVVVEGNTGTFIYYPPFKIDSYPDNATMFLFYADDAIYINQVSITKK